MSLREIPKSSSLEVLEVLPIYVWLILQHISQFLFQSISFALLPFFPQSSLYFLSAINMHRISPAFWPILYPIINRPLSQDFPFFWSSPENASRFRDNRLFPARNETCLLGPYLYSLPMLQQEPGFQDAQILLHRHTNRNWRFRCRIERVRNLLVCCIVAFLLLWFQLPTILLFWMLPVEASDNLNKKYILFHYWFC